MSENIIFSETQRFRQWWLMLILIGSDIGFAVAIFFTVTAKDFDANDISQFLPLVIGMMAVNLVTAFVIILRLETKISDEGIEVRMFPFAVKRYSWDKISKCFVRTYSPLTEFGGWGIRGRSDNRALNVSGSEGLQLKFKDGNSLLIGTQKGEEIKQALTQLPNYQSLFDSKTYGGNFKN
jgi:hypothetical protein